ncbi:AAA family ATPase [Acinetobacter bereziniae]|uniref:ATPase AAA-type core domain-containing protein n=1 Tax=Acinetobacter bereziniae NIPH 3 TaxID=1217651 RepID=N8YMX9_ACIBZ|nr:AAA family ATPase [Acinetobacter bereziniae]ENV20928.1 hypothetical protein F963_03059 [Acinetobacter bereziniae NIPH 3]
MNQTQNKLGKISIECMMNSSNNNGLDTMKVKSLEIKDVGGVSHLKLENLNERMNIICGANGVGKTNILDSIVYVFSEYDPKSVVNKSVGSTKGNIELETDAFENVLIKSINEYEPSNHRHSSISSEPTIFTELLNVIYLKVNRVFDYRFLDSISFSEKKLQKRLKSLVNGIDGEDLKGWLVSQLLLSTSPNALDLCDLENIEELKKSFSVLDSGIKYKSLKNNEIIVSTPTGDIYFEYLSSGFKSILFIILNIFRELSERAIYVTTSHKLFNGIILIDEVELHLHPEWQGRICTILKEVFPNAQFFITTHSPHVVQTAIKGEVIALERKNGVVERRELPESEYGYQGWTIEEILEDVMGMPDLRTKKYNEIKARFDKALDEQNKDDAKKAYHELDKMLHPQYPLRPVFKMQLDSLGE